MTFYSLTREVERLAEGGRSATGDAARLCDD